MRKFAILGRIPSEFPNGCNGVPGIVAVAVSLILAFGASAEGEPAGRDGIAAQVNGRVVTKSQVAILVAPELVELEERFPNRGEEFGKLVEAARKEALQQLTDQQKLIDQFNRPRVQLPPNAVEQEMKRVIRDDYGGDEMNLRGVLKKNRMTVDGFRDMLRDRLVAREIGLREAGKMR